MSVRNIYFVAIALFFVECLSANLSSVKAQSPSTALHSNGNTIQPVDNTTLHGKIMVGYQGWFNCPDDGANLGWKHWARNGRRPFGPRNVTVDLWPDTSELTESERYETDFEYADGSKGVVFSSTNEQTVARHFQWMQTYGIDGAFLQRFAVGLNGSSLRNNDQILSNVRNAAAKSGRVYAVMYDLSGLREGQVNTVLEDWKRLSEQRKITEDNSYLHHEGKPIVSVWGIGFSDNRQYRLLECRELVQSLKNLGCCVMLGVPSYWREGNRDAVDDPMLIETMKLADILSPWTIGRYTNPRQAQEHANSIWKLDNDWCQQHDIDFLPVAYPGFSWHNLHGGPLNQIPRLQGAFLWSQVEGAKRVGCSAIYIAMFDEVDEATAIFKCTNNPPTASGGEFITYEGLAPDFYLKLVGEAGKYIRGEPLPADSASKRFIKPSTKEFENR